ncbi:hypothetical protein HMPREF0208_02385 [Citrobacter koseri]|nr:hypothetical protein HMPREF3220_03169 [Citrobacter koseri]KXA00363.1 hypothetical protein HMPREF3207_03670 [Citrobacter koseri]KXB43982.1 hypothetical protein HMPREF0208_02385 [Citrobacter koseri]
MGSHKRTTAGFQVHRNTTRPFLTQRAVTGINIEHFNVNGKMTLPTEATSCERLHGILLMTGSTSGEKPAHHGLAYVQIKKD